MVQQIIFPSKPLKPFVQAYSCLEYNFEEKIIAPNVPRGTTALVFDVSQKRFIEAKGQLDNEAFHWNSTNPKSYLYGLIDVMTYVNFTGYFKMVMAILTPFGIHHLLKGEEKNTYNQMIYLEDLLPAIANIQDQIVEVEGFEAKVKIIEAFLMKCFEKSTYQVSYLDKAVGLILQNQGNIKVENLVKTCHVTERTLHRNFTEQVGFSPKEYARIIRFRSVMQYILQNPQTAWADLACQFGYTDQSHLIKDFQFFARASPEQFMQQNMEMDRHILKTV